jgi:glucose/arabinose dehydrogenase
MRRWTSILLLILLHAAAASAAGLEPVATGLGPALALTHAGDTRLFVTLQDGRIVVIDGAGPRTQPFLDIRDLVSCCGERGLLSAAFHPRYRENGFFYVNYTGRDGSTVVARYQVSGDPNVADRASAVTILTIAQPFANHNGGQMVFGADGYLYIATGDGGSGGDPNNLAQSLGTLLGKILRIDVDGGAPYAIPPDNPFVGQAGARGEIWAYGLRNPWRFTFDRATRDLWIADVGQGSWEEVNLTPASSRGGENYGWRRMEGAHCFNPSTNCNDGSLVLPLFEYSHSFGCSVTGGYRYRGSRYPRLAGTYFYGDFCSGTIWAARESGGTWSSEVFLETARPISSFGEDLTGEVYVVTIDGGVWRIVDEVRAPLRRRAVTSP